MKLSNFVCADAVIPELKASARDGVIGELVEALQKAGQISKDNCKKLIKALIERENEASTGLGKGIAVPHVKHESIKEVVAAVGRSSTGIDFAALDKQPVYTVILLLSPANKADKHLQAMESIFRNLRNEKVRRFLMQSQTVEQIMDLFKEADDRPAL